MTRRAVLLPGLFLLATLLHAGDLTHVADRWVNEDVERHKYGKIMVVGITEDPAARRRFENKFVSHLRGRGFECLVSYKFVPDLENIQAEDRITALIDEQQIDAAIVVRLVPLDGKNEDAWSDRWKKSVETEIRLRKLIEDSLPIASSKAKQFGVDVGLWQATDGARIWAGRSEVIALKQIKKGKSGEFIQAVLGLLKIDDLL